MPSTDTKSLWANACVWFDLLLAWITLHDPQFPLENDMSILEVDMSLFKKKQNLPKTFAILKSWIPTCICNYTVFLKIVFLLLREHYCVQCRCMTLSMDDIVILNFQFFGKLIGSKKNIYIISDLGYQS